MRNNGEAECAFFRFIFDTQVTKGGSPCWWLFPKSAVGWCLGWWKNGFGRELYFLTQTLRKQKSGTVVISDSNWTECTFQIVIKRTIARFRESCEGHLNRNVQSKFGISRRSSTLWCPHKCRSKWNIGKYDMTIRLKLSFATRCSFQILSNPSKSLSAVHTWKCKGGHKNDMVYYCWDWFHTKEKRS